MATSIHRETFWMFDGFSIATSIHRDPLAVDTSRQILDSSLIAFSRVLILDTSQHLSICRDLCFSIYRICAIVFSFHLDLSRHYQSLHLPKPLFLTPNLQPKCYLVFVCIFYFWFVSFSLIHHAFHVFDLTFWVCVENLGFFKIVRFLTKFLGWFL